MAPQEPIDTESGKSDITEPPLPDPTESPAATKPRSKKKLLVISALLLLTAATVLALFYFTKGESTVSTSASKVVTSSGSKRSVFCVGLGLRSVQCEDLDTKERRKYELPDAIANISEMIPSKDGRKFLVHAWKPNPGKNTGSTEVLSVYDDSLKLLATLPATYAENSGAPDIHDVNWLDNKSTIYTKTSGDKKKVYAFDVATRKETLLLEVDATIERFIPSGDRQFVYGIQGLVNPATNSVERKLVVIDTETKAIKDVANNVVNVNRQDLAYSPVSSLFYANILHQAEQTGDMRVYKVDNLATKPTLTFVQQIDKVWYVAPYAYRAIATSKGVLAQPGLDLSLRTPVRFYTATNEYSETKLAVGGNGTIKLSLQDFPNFARAKTDEAVTRDFFKPAANTPDKIITFLDKMVTETPECRPGEYVTFELQKTDGDKQFSAVQYGCESDYLAFYALQNGTYKMLGSTQEGMSCEQRDRLGISEKVFPDCMKPGEGL